MLHTLFFERLEGNPSKKENIPIIMLDVGCVSEKKENRQNLILEMTKNNHVCCHMDRSEKCPA